MAGNGYEFGRSSTVMAPSWDTLVLFFFSYFSLLLGQAKRPMCVRVLPFLWKYTFSFGYRLFALSPCVAVLMCTDCACHLVSGLVCFCSGELLACLFVDVGSPFFPSLAGSGVMWSGNYTFVSSCWVGWLFAALIFIFKHWVLGFH